MRACVCLWCSGWFVTTLPDTDFVAKLTDVFPDGTSMLIQVWRQCRDRSCGAFTIRGCVAPSDGVVWCGVVYCVLMNRAGGVCVKQGSPVIATNTILHGGQYPSSVTLPGLLVWAVISLRTYRTVL